MKRLHTTPEKQYILDSELDLRAVSPLSGLEGLLSRF
jgi:hypothetical protein